MPKFAANISMMFNEYNFLDRFAAAAAAGFEGVEFLFPYEYSSEEIKKCLDENNLTQALFNTYAGNWEDNERGFGSIPGAIVGGIIIGIVEQLCGTYENYLFGGIREISAYLVLILTLIIYPRGLFSDKAEVKKV